MIDLQELAEMVTLHGVTYRGDPAAFVRRLAPKVKAMKTAILPLPHGRIGVTQGKGITLAGKQRGLLRREGEDGLEAVPSLPAA